MKRGKSKENLKIKVVIFDVGGVLALGKYSNHPIKNHRLFGVHAYVSKKLKISMDQWFDSIDSTYADAIEGKVSEEKFISVLAKNNKIYPKKLKKIFLKSYKKSFKINKDLYKFAFKLKKKGYKIAILSDQHYISKQALMPKKYIKRFDEVVVSCDVEMRKPNPKIYKLLLKRLNISAQNTIFIDNQDWNLKPAKKLKMNILLFKNNEQTIKDLEKMGVKVK